MAKAVTKSVRKIQNRRLGMDKELLRVACDDGTTYEFRRQAGEPRWRAVARYSPDGNRSAEPSRLPAAVEAHMDGQTGSGPHGRDGSDYWVA